MANSQINEYHQEIGFAIDNWKGRDAPQRVTLTGEFCELQPLSIKKHAVQLFESFRASGDIIWTYLPIGPYADLESYTEFVSSCSQNEQDVHFAVVDKASKRAVGTLALIRADPQNGSVEVGYVIYSSQLKKTPVATEAQYLLMKYVFGDLKYRRYEWKCDSLNLPSKQAALRLGFKFEGTFRQVAVYKGRNRDTSWLSVIDKEWDLCRSAFEEWLGPENLKEGVQAKGLSDIRQSHVNRRI